jgi:hypothetical protein
MAGNKKIVITLFILFLYNLQIIIQPLHVLTLLCHSQGARSQYLAKLRKYGNAAAGVT